MCVFVIEIFIRCSALGSKFQYYWLRKSLFSFSVLKVLGCGRTAAVQCRWEDGCVCLQCPAGQEPSKVRLQTEVKWVMTRGNDYMENFLIAHPWTLSASWFMLNIIAINKTKNKELLWSSICSGIHFKDFFSFKQACWQIQSPLEKVRCHTCPAGSFSDTYDADFCRPHTSCKSLRRTLVIPGTASADSICGDCLSG